MPFNIKSTSETRPLIFKPIDTTEFKDEKLHWLGKATEWLFDFGQDGFEVVVNPGKNNLIEKKATPAQDFKAVALKVLQIAAKILLIATVIVPVVALICRAVYLRKNDLCVRTLTLNDKSTYVGGTNAENQPTGKGKIIESDGNMRISGVFTSEGITDGVYTFNSGQCNFSLGRRSKYSGGLDENGQPHGNGKMEYTGSANRDHYRIFSGGTFEGEFEHGDWAVTGKYTKSDSMSGPRYLPEHTVFEGEFDDRNNPQYLIKGTITDIEGTVRTTVGDAAFDKGNYRGQLKEVYKDGTVIEGEFNWQNVLYPTFISGKVTFPCGAVYKKTPLDNGTYEKSVTFPEVYETDPTLAGQRYQSDAFKALKDDDGKKPSNEVLAPVLSQIFDGQVKVTYPNFEYGTYVGEFKDNMPHGIGELTDSKGEILDVRYENGVCQKKLPR